MTIWRELLPGILFLLALFAVVYCIAVWGITALALAYQSRRGEPAARRAGELVRFLASPFSLLVSLLGELFTPLVVPLAAVILLPVLLITWPIGLLLRLLPGFIRWLVASVDKLGDRILHIDFEIAWRTRILGDRILKLVVGEAILLGSRFPRLSRLTSQRTVGDIRRSNLPWLIERFEFVLFALTSDPNQSMLTRLNALNAMLQLRGADAMADLQEIIRTPALTPDVAFAAARGIEQFDSPDAVEQARLAWITISRHERPEARLEAARDLKRLGDTPRAVETLMTLAYDPGVGPLMHIQAARRLGEIGEEQIAQRVLAPLAKNRDPQVRMEAAAALVSLGQSDYLREVDLLLIDPTASPLLRRQALDHLGRLGQVELLMREAGNSSNDLTGQWGAAEALERWKFDAQAALTWIHLARRQNVPESMRRQALQHAARLYREEIEQSAGPEDLRAAEMLRVLGESVETPAGIRLEAANTLLAMGKNRQANTIYVFVSNDRRAEAGIRQAAERAVRTQPERAGTAGP